MTTRNLKIDLTPGGAPQVIRVSQYDNGARRLLVSLTDGDKGAFTIPEGATVKVDGTKPSGKGFSDACTISGNQVTVTIKDTMTDEPGRVYCELVLTKDSARLGSAKFELDVDRGALDPEAIIESDTFEGIIKDAVRECANEQLIELTVDMELSNESSNPVANKVVSNLFAGALKGYASGASIQVDDVSPLEHSPVVRVHGKNLIPYPYRNTTLTIGGVTFTDDGSGGISMNGTSTGGCNFFFTGYTFTLKKGKKYTFSVGGDFSATAGVDFWIYSTTLQKGLWMNAAAAKATTFIADSNYIDAAIYCVIGKGTQVTGSMCPMVEESDTATAYEPWVDPTTFKVTDGKGNTFTPNTDGTVEGVTSTSPTMTLSLNKEGATIDVEYNRDLTKVIAKIEAALFN